MGGLGPWCTTLTPNLFNTGKPAAVVRHVPFFGGKKNEGERSSDSMHYLFSDINYFRPVIKTRSLQMNVQQFTPFNFTPDVHGCH